jgi:hypothetical protein
MAMSFWSDVWSTATNTNVGWGLTYLVPTIVVAVTALMLIEHFRRNVWHWLSHCLPPPRLFLRRTFASGSLGSIVHAPWFGRTGRCWALRQAGTASLNYLGSLVRKPSTYRGIHISSSARRTVLLA